MNANRCAREDELLDALGRGFTGADLDAHLAGCAECSELRLVAGALLDDRRDAFREAALPAAGTMWWRMQLRKRQEAQAAARRSLLIGQALTLVAAIALVGSIFGADLVVGARQVVASLRAGAPMIVAIATWILIAPIAGWVALRQK